MRIIQINAGRTQVRTSAKGREEATGIGKQPVSGPIHVGPRGLDGDESAYRNRADGDTAVHGFASESYDLLAAELGESVSMPAFGENLLFEDYRECDARIGDLLAIGTALLRVNQPVPRCTWPGVVSGVKALGPRAMKLGVPGWYMAVERAGVMQAGDQVVLVERGDANWTIRRLNALLLDKSPDPAMIADALAQPALAERFKAELIG